MGYHAFISYSHRADGPFAARFQRGLQRFAKPWFRARAVRVFRDATSLSASPALLPSLEAALADSEYLVLLASPSAAVAPWVERELKAWLARKPADRILIVLTDGDIVWSDAHQDFDWSKTNALPRCLAAAFRAEPRFVDARHSDDPAVFADCVADIAAVLHGRPKDELCGEELKAQRLFRGAVGGAVVLALALACAVALFWIRARSASRAEVSQRRVSTSRRLAAEAAALVSSRLDDAAALAVAAHSSCDSAEARAALFQVSERLERLDAVVSEPEAHASCNGAAAPNGTLAAFIRSDGAIILRSLDGARTKRLGSIAANAESLVRFSENSRFLAVTATESVLLFDLQRNRRHELAMTKIGGKTPLPSALEFSPDSTLLVLGDGSGDLRAWNPETGNEEWSNREHLGPITEIRFSRRGDRLLATDAAVKGTVRLWQLRTGELLQTIVVEKHLAQDAVLLPDDSAVVILSNGRLMQVPVGAGPSATKTVELPGGSRLAMAADGVLAIGDNAGRIHLRRGGIDGAPQTLASPHRLQIQELAFSRDGSRLVSRDAGGAFAVMDVGKDRTLIGTLQAHGGVMGRPQISRSGAHVAVVHSDCTATRWYAQSRPVINRFALDPGGRWIASVEEGSLQLWDAATLLQVSRPYRPGETDLLCLAFTPDGQHLAAAATDGRAYLFDVQQRSFGPSLSPPESVQDARAGENTLAFDLAVSPDGKTLAAAFNVYAEGALRARPVLWELADGRTTLPPVPPAAGSVQSLLFDRSGTQLGMLFGDHAAIWDVAGGRWISTTPHAQPERINTPHFETSADGTLRLVSGASGATFDERGLIVKTDLEALSLWDARSNARTPLRASREFALFALASNDVMWVRQHTGEVERWLVSVPGMIERACRFAVGAQAAASLPPEVGDGRAPICPSAGKASATWEWMLEDVHGLPDPADDQQLAAEIADLVRAARDDEVLARAAVLLAKNPSSLRAREARAVALWRKGRPEQALAEIEPIDSQASGSAAHHTTRGLILDALGRTTEALDEYDRAARLAPSDGRIQYNRGLALRKLGHRYAALWAFEFAAQGEPGLAPVQIERAGLLIELGRWKEALQAFDRALDAAPGDAAALAGRGYALLELHRNEEALAAFDRALAVDPRDWRSHLKRGDALAALGRRKQADAAFALALRTIAEDPLPSRYVTGDVPRDVTLAYLLVRLGKRKDAAPLIHRVQASGYAGAATVVQWLTKIDPAFPGELARLAAR